MSFRGGNSRGRGFSGGRGGGGFASRGAGRGGGGGGYQREGPPDTVLEMGSFVHACEGEMVCESTNLKIPYFNAPIYLENKTTIGVVDEILGPVNQVFFTIKPQEGIVAASFKSGDKFYIDFFQSPRHLLVSLSLREPVAAREDLGVCQCEEAGEVDEELQEAAEVEVSLEVVVAEVAGLAEAEAVASVLAASVPAGEALEVVDFLEVVGSPAVEARIRKISSLKALDNLSCINVSKLTEHSKPRFGRMR
ncbi:MAG: H/ACA snoRNP pseudouridylase subunit [Trizodia sp. TS-e1964]|nr:MAG: H/ACA snoRNP pseudouridylase subunit [Trizodia sp. TS-e1964]